MSTKQQAIQAIEAMPDEADVSDIMERLYLIFKVQRGLQQAEAGQKVTQEEARDRMAKWLK